MINTLQRKPPRAFRPVAGIGALALVAASVLTACADMSGIHSSAEMRPAASFGLEPGGEVAAAWSHQSWWKDYGDAQLDAVVEQALAGNPSLKMAQIRLDRAQAVVSAAKAPLLPSAELAGDVSRDKFTANTLYPPPLGGATENSAALQAQGSWELDFFGKNRAALDASIGAAQAAAADAQAARLLLASNVVRQYFQLAREEAQLGVAKRTLTQREQMLALVHSRLNAGLDTQLELRQSQGGIPEARLQIETVLEQQALTRNALAALAGDPGLAARLKAPGLPAAGAVPVPAAVPADLLGRRADIVAARWRVEAATQDTASARAKFYPNINLTAYAGWSSFGFSNLFKSSSEQWGFSPAFSLPLFEGGRLRANLRAKTADLDGAIESYNAAVLDAVHEVADQLALSQSVARQQDEQAQALRVAESSYEIARQRYQAGLSTQLQVLAAESTVLTQRRAEVDLKARALDTQVALWRVLGGGFQAQPLSSADEGSGAFAKAALRAQSALAGSSSQP
ncbi:MAG: efflux transporter outer membrane subunit [Curvibacter sp.]|nr:efflux transporter outer membrane subunit [Curvibacter sp.]